MGVRSLRYYAAAYCCPFNQTFLCLCRLAHHNCHPSLVLTFFSSIYHCITISHLIRPAPVRLISLSPIRSSLYLYISRATWAAFRMFQHPTRILDFSVAHDPVGLWAYPLSCLLCRVVNDDERETVSSAEKRKVAWNRKNIKTFSRAIILIRLVRNCEVVMTLTFRKSFSRFFAVLYIL